MNYESIGRYSEAVESATSQATVLHNAFARLGRMTARTDFGSGAIGCEHDFNAIRAAVEEAEQAYLNMLASVAEANHEAGICGKPAVKLYKVGK